MQAGLTMVNARLELRDFFSPFSAWSMMHRNSKAASVRTPSVFWAKIGRKWTCAYRSYDGNIAGIGRFSQGVEDNRVEPQQHQQQKQILLGWKHSVMMMSSPSRSLLLLLVLSTQNCFRGHHHPWPAINHFHCIVVDSVVVSVVAVRRERSATGEFSGVFLWVGRQQQLWPLQQPSSRGSSSRGYLGGRVQHLIKGSLAGGTQSWCTGGVDNGGWHAQAWGRMVHQRTHLTLVHQNYHAIAFTETWTAYGSEGRGDEQNEEQGRYGSSGSSDRSSTSTRKPLDERLCMRHHRSSFTVEKSNRQPAGMYVLSSKWSLWITYFHRRQPWVRQISGQYSSLQAAFKKNILQRWMHWLMFSFLWFPEYVVRAQIWRCWPNCLPQNHAWGVSCYVMILLADVCMCTWRIFTRSNMIILFTARRGRWWYLTPAFCTC